MSSPTINSFRSSGDTSLATIMNLVRALVNDSQAGATGTPGEGQVFTNNPAISPFTQPFLNSSIRELYRELRNAGQPTLVKDNIIITGLTPVNSPAHGPGQPDPAVQVYLGFGGYFDGVEINSDLVLPDDVINVERVWERQTGTENSFTPMQQPQFGLPSRLQQTLFAEWEWRNDNIWMVGSTETRDLRLRYWAALPQFFSPNPGLRIHVRSHNRLCRCSGLQDGTEVRNHARQPGRRGAEAEAAEQMRQLKLANVRRAQSVDYSRIPYGNYSERCGLVVVNEVRTMVS
jgi:hypothetical protein